MKSSTHELMCRAKSLGYVIPALNVPYLPMMEPMVRALRDTETFALIQVARLEFTKFQARDLRAVRDEYLRVRDERFTRLHLDHVPVIDEDGGDVDYLGMVREALELGYESVMVDGSRLPLPGNIEATRKVVELAHEAGVPAEAELGAVMGHEAGPLPPYDELFASGKGFTDPEEAGRFVAGTGVDWLSVAIGNIHGAVSGAASKEKKLQARLNLEHLDRIREQARVPLVLHGGSGIRKECLLAAFRRGIAKINVGTTLRQAYEQAAGSPTAVAQQRVYEQTVKLVTDELEVRGSARVLNP